MYQYQVEYEHPYGQIPKCLVVPTDKNDQQHDHIMRSVVTASTGC